MSELGRRDRVRCMSMVRDVLDSKTSSASLTATADRRPPMYGRTPDRTGHGEGLSAHRARHPA